MIKTIIFLYFILLSTSAFADRHCVYVNSVNGLNLREEPNIKANIIKTLSYGTKLGGYIKAPLDSLHIGDKVVRGNWIYVSLLTKEDRKVTGGYVFDAYLSEHLKTIPERSLYYYNRLYIQDHSKNEFEIKYRLDYSNNYSINDCMPRYSKNRSVPIIQNKTDSINLYSSSLDTLKHYIKIEKVNVSDYKKKKSEFEIDTIFQPDIFKESYLLKYFYLEIRKGQDSICIRDTEGEGYTSHDYIGEIKALNKYLIKECYELCSVYTIDKQSGEKEYFPGIPYISPNGSYQISFSHNDFPMLDKYLTTTLSIVRKDKKQYSISIDFKSWIPAEGINNIFWVSENEFIVKVSPVDNYVTSYLDNHKEPMKHYEYLKIKMLESLKN
ncbi:MAG: SH3 domain-containing protein [Nonlabens sp.]